MVTDQSNKKPEPDNDSRKIFFASRLRLQRQRRGWSQEDLAEKVGTDSKTISRWERAKILPGPHYRQSLMELFEVKPEELGFVGYSFIDEFKDDDSPKVNDKAIDNQSFASDNDPIHIPARASYAANAAREFRGTLPHLGSQPILYAHYNEHQFRIRLQLTLVLIVSITFFFSAVGSFIVFILTKNQYSFFVPAIVAAPVLQIIRYSFSSRNKEI